MPKPYIPNDSWSQRAAKEGFRARSVYKLQELDQRFRLLKSGMTVLDIGAAPGSWLQYISQKIGEKGKVIGFDLQSIEPIAPNVLTYQQDIFDDEGMKALLVQNSIQKVDLIVSDLAPKTSGIRDIDQWKSIELSHAVVHIASQFLKKNGICVLKILRGADFDEFVQQMKQEWDTVHLRSVQASRDRSTEVYVILKGKKNPIKQIKNA